jgi:hypothetical protein
MIAPHLNSDVHFGTKFISHLDNMNSMISSAVNPFGGSQLESSMTAHKLVDSPRKLEKSLDIP